MAASTNVTLNTGSKVPAVGLGTWKAPPGVTANIVFEAIKVGYRALDCACDYGNEHEVGAGIRKAIKGGLCKREDLLVTSKLWNTFHRAEHVRPALLKTLDDLGLDSIDLYMIHFPIPLRYVPFEKRYPPEWIHNPDVPEEATLIIDYTPVGETWAAMESLVDEGLVKDLGVCNFNVALLMDLLGSCRIRPAMLQVELHPYLQQQKLLDFCARESIAVTAFSPLGSSSYSELGMDKGHGVGVLNEPVVTAIAKRLERSPAQVVLRWGIQRGVCVIPKTSKAERLLENYSLFDFELTNDDMKGIGALERGTRYNDPGVFCVGMGFPIPIYD
jgi:diketogulonate reductase-like aldo/keto reductase